MFRYYFLPKFQRLIKKVAEWDNFWYKAQRNQIRKIMVSNNLNFSLSVISLSFLLACSNSKKSENITLIEELSTFATNNQATIIKDFTTIKEGQADAVGISNNQIASGVKLNAAELKNGVIFTGTISKSLNSGENVKVTLGGVSVIAVVSGTIWSAVFDSDMVNIPNNLNADLTAEIVNISGQQGVILSATTINKIIIDQIAPNAPSLKLSAGISDGATQSEAIAQTGVVLVAGESGATIVITITNNTQIITKTILSAGNNETPIVLTQSDITTLGIGLISVTAVATDVSGNPSLPASISFNLTSIVPLSANPPIINAVNINANGNLDIIFDEATIGELSAALPNDIVAQNPTMTTATIKIAGLITNNINGFNLTDSTGNETHYLKQSTATADNDIIIGTSGNDNSLLGGAGRDIILGGAGNDTIDGGAGVDFVFGQSGNDILVFDATDAKIDGGVGDDTLKVNNAATLTINSGNLINIEDVDASASNAIVNITGDNGANIIIGGHNNDILNGADGADQLSGGDGNDSINGGNDADNISGGGGDDILNGGNGGDNLIAEDGNDTINGGNGGDNLNGGLGMDILTGGAGDDNLNGGNGNDIFNLDLSLGIDTIADFGGSSGLETDIMQISGLSPSSAPIVAQNSGVIGNISQAFTENDTDNISIANAKFYIIDVAGVLDFDGIGNNGGNFVNMDGAGIMANFVASNGKAFNANVIANDKAVFLFANGSGEAQLWLFNSGDSSVDATDFTKIASLLDSSFDFRAFNHQHIEFI